MTYLRRRVCSSGRDRGVDLGALLRKKKYECWTIYTIYAIYMRIEGLASRQSDGTTAFT
jgi:hypothetical protein